MKEDIETILIRLVPQIPGSPATLGLATEEREKRLEIIEKISYQIMNVIEKRNGKNKDIENQVYNAIVTAFQFDENGYLKVCQACKEGR